MKVLQLPVNELKSALAGFNKIVSKGTTLPVLGCVRVQPQAEGVDLQVTDLDSFATCRITADAPADFPPCLVSLATLSKVAKTSQDRISLIHEGNGRIKLRQVIGGHAVDQTIDSVPIEEWPTVPQIKASPILVEPTFKQALSQALECVGHESTRLMLTGVCLDVSRPECHCVVGCDGRHLYSANTFHFPWTDSVVIPHGKFLTWSGFTSAGDWLVAIEPVPDQNGNSVRPYVQIQSGPWTFLTRSLDGTYPNWRQVVPNPERDVTRVQLSDEAVGAMLDVLPRMPGSEDASQPVTIALRSGKLILGSRSRLSEQATEIPIPGATISGQDQRICLDRSFITKGLRFGFTEFEVQDGLSPAVFTAPGRKMVVSPMRLEGVPASAPEAPTSTQESPQPTTGPAEAPESATPSAGQAHNQTEQHESMATTNNITALPVPERGNLKSINGANGDNNTAVKAVIDQVEKIKTNLRDVIADLNDTLDLLKAAEKEKKASLKEIESIRSTLRSLQKVEI